MAKIASIYARRTRYERSHFEQAQVHRLWQEICAQPVYCAATRFSPRYAVRPSTVTAVNSDRRKGNELSNRPVLGQFEL